jgi:putative restriction endonuclease
MRYWWVNQNQTFDHEFLGGYLWSPKRKSNQARNPFYEFMPEVAPGDIIFSFQGTFIRALGVAQSHCYEAPKPTEFGTAGTNWSNIGWKVEVRYSQLKNQIRPADEMAILLPLLPVRYSPLQQTGRGIQSVYLTHIPENLATALVGLIGFEARELVRGSYVGDQAGPELTMPDILQWEDHIAGAIAEDDTIPETEREALVMARRGQGRFKKNVQLHESKCRVTGVDRIEHLIASHCKPWRDCGSNQERLDGENGLLLTPSIDHLFDRGFITFENDGRLLISTVAHKESLRRMGVPVNEVRNVGRFTDGQKSYLEFHRENLFLEARI